MNEYLQYDEEEVRALQPRFRIVFAALIFCFVIIFLRLVYLQIIQGQTLRQFSERNLLKELKVDAPRGKIFDRNGELLAENLPGFAVTISPQYVKNLPLLAEDLSEIVKLPASKIIKKVKDGQRRGGQFRPIVIKGRLSRDEVFQTQLLKIYHTGLDIKEHFIRSYKVSESAGHILGYVAEISRDQIKTFNKSYDKKYTPGDMVGKKGIEKYYESLLSGLNGTSFVKVDAKGRLAPISENMEFLDGLVDDVPASAGNNIHLTIDKDLQQRAYDLFTENGLSGALVAINNVGEVLAITSAPAFNPNDFSTGISSKLWKKLSTNPLLPLWNKAVQSHHSPGSTFKPIVALAGLEEKKVSRWSQVFAGSSWRVGNRTFHDHTRTGQGNINIVQALEASSNVFFYKLGAELGVDNIAKYAKALGFGKKTGIDLYGEVSGLIPTRAWKMKKHGEPWQPGENANVSVGQGFVLTSPLQLAVSYNAIATNGKVVRPIIMRRVTNPAGRVITEVNPDIKAEMSLDSSDVTIDKKNFSIVREGLFKVTHGQKGTAKRVRVKGFPISGKTGTAQVRSFSASEIYKSCFDRPLKHRHNGWFAGFAPKDKPEIVVVVLAEHACKSSKTLPIAKGFLETYFKKYHPEKAKQAEGS